MKKWGLRNEILRQYHDALWNIGINKTYKLMNRKYYRRALYKKVNTYMNSCISYSARISKHEIAPLMEMDVPEYPYE